MTKVLHGIVHGKSIEVSEDLGMLDGQAVELILMPSGAMESLPESARPRRSPKKLPGPPPGWRPDGAATAAGLLAEEWTEEDDRLLDQIQAERKSAKRRELPE
jgi:hypothetical protein